MDQSTRMWVHGIIAAFVGGGASAITATFSSAVIAPSQFNLSSSGGIHHVAELVALTFLVNGGLAVALYLKQSPVPPDWDGSDRRGDATKPA